jgi:valine--pyruvate aminotransferase
MELSAWGTKMAGLSGIRSILEDIAVAVSDRSATGWLNLSPGNPALIPDVVKVWRRLEEDALAHSFEASARYGPSRGTDGLVDAIVRYFNDRYGWHLTPRNVVVGPGNQMLCFIATTLFTGPTPGGHRRLVLPSVPDYTGYQGLSLETGGIVGVEPKVVTGDGRYFRYDFNLDAVRRTPAMGMMLLSSPSNPTGRCVSADELAALVRIAEERDVPLVVDHAYGEPFPGVAGPAVDPVDHPNVINCFTASKAGLPGERIGFAIGAPAAIDPMVSFIANTALHAPQLIQTVLQRALAGGELDALTSEVIRPYYRRKRELAEKLLHDLLPDELDWRLHSSEGGMFCWLWLDHPWFDDLTAYESLKRKRVFVVPGRHFFVGPMTTPFLADHGTRCIRLSLSADEAVIAEGIGRIAETLREMHRGRPVNG